jgi:hypothetical protein
MKNFTHTEHNVNPGSDTTFSGQKNEWDCGCQSYSGGATILCSAHSELPPILRRMSEPVKVNSLGHGSSQYGEVRFWEGDTEEFKKIRRRVEDALRKGGDGKVFRCAEILGVKIFD